MALLTFTTIVKRRDICKADPAGLFQSKISSQYRMEAVRFQYAHNTAHPGNRIWRHMLYKRVFHFLHRGILQTVKVEMVRFIYVNSGRTFTFYGTLFLPRIRYARDFIRKAIFSSESKPRFFFSVKTILRWKKAYDMSLPAQDHNSATPPASPGMV